MKFELKDYKKILEKEGIKASPKTNFKTFGLMYDFARARILKLDYLKELLTKVSKFGVNEFWFYMEDLLKIDVPYFGYQRGGYTKEEYKELDKHASSLGIELVFSIQTLGHMEEFIRWPSSDQYADNQRVLLAGDNKVYEIIYKMLEFCKASFKSTKIHIGLDETWGLGSGNYLRKNGYKDPGIIFMNHLEKVKEIALRVGFKDILMWSDMLITLNLENTGYYNLKEELKKESAPKILKDFNFDKLNLVFWDYYTTDLEKLENNLKSHLSLTDKVTFASGFWIWQRPIVDLTRTKPTVDAAIKACNKLGIKDINFTLWNGHGGYCNPDDILISLPYTAEKIFNLPEGSLIPLYEKLENKDLKITEERDIINSFGYDAIGVLYDDPLLGIFLNNYYKFHNKKVLDNISRLNNFHIEKYKEIDEEFYHLFYILKLKQELRVTFLNNLGKPKELKKLIPDYKKLADHYIKYQEVFVSKWQKTSKENGLELHHVRLSGLITRIKHLISLIEKEEDFTKIIDLPVQDQHIDPRFERVFPSKYLF